MQVAMVIASQFVMMYVWLTFQYCMIHARLIMAKLLRLFFLLLVESPFIPHPHTHVHFHISNQIPISYSYVCHQLLEIMHSFEPHWLRYLQFWSVCVCQSWCLVKSFKSTTPFRPLLGLTEIEFLGRSDLIGHHLDCLGYSPQLARSCYYPTSDTM